MVLEDIHWADRATLAWLEFVAGTVRQPYLGTVCTFRRQDLLSNPALGRVIREFERSQQGLLIGLEPLAVPAAKHLAALRGAPPQALVSVAERSRGNPFYIEILAGAAQRTGGQALDSAFSDPVAGLLASQAAGWSTECQRALQAAAVLGDQFPLALLSLVLGTPEVDLARPVADAGTAGILANDLMASNLIRFAHPLMRESVYRSIPRALRRRLHAAAAAAMQQLSPDDGESPAALIADHLWRAMPVVAPAQLVPHALQAADHALALGSPGEARPWLERILSLNGTVSLRQRADTLALSVRGHLAKAGQLAEAFSLYMELGLTEEAAAVAGFPGFYGMRDADLAIDVTQRALRLHVSPHGHARILMQHAVNLYNGGRVAAARTCLQKAGHEAGVLGDPQLQVRARYPVPYEQSPIASAVSFRQLATDLAAARGADDFGLELRIRCRMPDLVMTHGLADAFRNWLPQTLALAHRIRGGSCQTMLLATTCPLFVLGDWQLIRDVAAALDRDFPGRMGRTLQIELLGFLEHSAQAARAQLQLLQLHSPPGYMAPIVASLVAVYGLRSGSRRCLAGARRAAEATLRASSSELIRANAAVAQAICVAASQERDLAEDLLETVAELRDQHTLHWVMGHDHLLGLLAHTAGHHKTALAYLHAAVEYHSRLSHLTLAAWAKHDLAALLVVQDPAQSIELAESAARDATTLSMRPLAESSQKLIRAASRAISRTRLTPRELQTLDLLALGKSNMEIAYELGISQKTVAAHLSHIYAKTGASGRTEAIRLVLSPLD